MPPTVDKVLRADCGRVGDWWQRAAAGQNFGRIDKRVKETNGRLSGRCRPVNVVETPTRFGSFGTIVAVWTLFAVLVRVFCCGDAHWTTGMKVSGVSCPTLGTRRQNLSDGSDAAAALLVASFVHVAFIQNFCQGKRSRGAKFLNDR